MDRNDVTLLVADEELLCARVGQRGKLWRIKDDATVSIVLACGHPHLVPLSSITVDEGSNAAVKLKEFQMAKAKTNTAVAKPPVSSAAKQKVAASSVPMTGHETNVVAYRKKMEALDWLKEEVEDLKGNFRDAAYQAAFDTEFDSSSFSFEDGKGSHVKVSISDPSLAGNRVIAKQTAPFKARMEEAGIDVDSLLETTHTYTLDGDFVTWLDTLLEQWGEQGVAIPDGLTKREVTKLSAEGAAQMQAIAKDNIAAREILMSFIKSPMVKGSK